MAQASTSQSALVVTVADAHVTMAQNSKSFAMAAKVFPAHVRDAAAVVYAYCRRVDDEIDNRQGQAQVEALQRLRSELTALYQPSRGEPVAAHLQQLQQVIVAHRIPRLYFDELLRGMELDVSNTHYRTMDQLVDYCYCVASTVGLIMCHIMGVSTKAGAPKADTLQRAAHLGIAMQLTNICRDVAEDERNGRVYLPDELLQSHQVALDTSEALIPSDGLSPLSPVIQSLLTTAERYYRSGQAGAVELPWRCSFAIRAARRIYAAIGSVIAEGGYDVYAGRAVVSKSRKMFHVAIAALQLASEMPRRCYYRLSGRRYATPLSVLEVQHVARL
jgi:15-cis-phytoene synthase